MKKLHYEIKIDASPEVVWLKITTLDDYKKWASVFDSSCYYVGGWNTGDQIKFLGIGQDGKIEGMVSQIAESRYPYFISIRHKGIISDGQIDLDSQEVKSWAPSYEDYTILRTEDGTLLRVDMDSEDKHVQFFDKQWPEALQIIRNLAESHIKSDDNISIDSNNQIINY